MNADKHVMPDTSLEMGLADVICVMHRLSPKSQFSEQAIAVLFGFEWGSGDLGVVDEYHLDHSRKTLTKSADEASDLLVERLWQGKSSAVPERLEPFKRGAPPTIEEGDDFSLRMESVEELPEKSPQLHTGAPPYVPLFKDRWVRGIMSVLIAMPELLPRLDLKLIERLLASGSLIEQLPYVSRQTMNRGVQLLVDVSESSLPFWRDGAELITVLQRLLDPTYVSIHKFEFEQWPEPHLTWWEGGPDFLREAVPILLMSNFGVTTREALPTRLGNNEPVIKLLRQATNKKCPLVALVPAAEQDWPTDLKSLIPMSFVWDQPTSPQAVYRKKRR